MQSPQGNSIAEMADSSDAVPDAPPVKSLMQRSSLGPSATIALQSLSNLSANTTHSEYGDADQESLKLAALERLPTYDRLRTAVISRALEDGKYSAEEVDVAGLTVAERQKLVERVMETNDQDNERLLTKLRARLDAVNIQFPTVEVKFADVKVDASVYTGSRALPTLPNFTQNVLESLAVGLRLLPDRRQEFPILHSVSGVLKPGRMTLLLGPPGAGKSTLMKYLAGILDGDLRATGAVTYNGHGLDEFVPVRTSAYVSQNDNHIGEMTVRETLDFSARVQGPGYRADMLRELLRREKEAGIKPDPSLDAFMKAQATQGTVSNITTDYFLKVLGLEVCADTIVGNEMLRGISGGQKKRVTTGEMIVGPKQVLFMDEISTGLDSSTTFLITKCLRHFTQLQDATTLIALLQPAPETYDLFDDIMLLAEGHVVYHGPRDQVLPFFEAQGFRCPPRKGAADFLQEVTSLKDQEQYWHRPDLYKYVPVVAFEEAFKLSQQGQVMAAELKTPFAKEKSPEGALSFEPYGLPRKEMFRAVLDREVLLLKRNAFLYVAMIIQMSLTALVAGTLFFRTTLDQTVEDGSYYLGALFFGFVIILFNGFAEMSILVIRLPVFYKQRDMLLFPSWALSIPIWVLSIPFSAAASFAWTAITYYLIGFSPAAGRFFRQWLTFFTLHQVGIAIFRLIAALARSMVLSNTCGAFAIITLFLLGGFVIAKDYIHPYWIWGFYVSPLSYIMNCLTTNEFLADRWQIPANQTTFPGRTVGQVVLHNRSLFNDNYMFYAGIAVNWGYDMVEAKHAARTGESLNTTSGRVAGSSSVKSSRSAKDGGHGSALDKFRANKLNSARTDYLSSTGNTPQASSLSEGAVTSMEQHAAAQQALSEAGEMAGTGMVLPFEPLSLSFDHVNYYVDMPAEMKSEEVQEARLQLLRDVSGAFRPGVLTALVGVSGAGKTTLMDVLAGRKTGGYIEGDIRVSGYPKVQETFARIMGYCEQNDVHSPQVTIYESLLYSAWLRLPVDVDEETRKEFVEEVMALVELSSLRDALVGLPGVNGLSTEQRKRLTIAVELVANPSIIFMDEPTSGLDARAAAIVMRTVRNTVNTGRTVVCTIHQPSIDIFEAFDELLLMKRGGQVIYMGPLGRDSQLMIDYFQSIEGVPKISKGYNPATWMLEISSPAAADRLGLDFADIFAKSEQFKSNERLIETLKTPPEGHQDLAFATRFSTSLLTQLYANLWKRQLMYWRTPDYNVVRYAYTGIMGLIIGSIFFGLGIKRKAQQNVFNAMGALYTSSLFIGWNNAASVQPIVAIERTVFYRERAAGYYSAIPYALAQGLIEIPYVLSQCLLYCVIVYPLVHFEWTAAKFFWFTFFTFLTLMYFTYYGMMAISLTPNDQLSMVLSIFFFGLWNVFSGFLIPRPAMNQGWRWYYWANPVAWTLYGLIASQMGDVEKTITQPGVSPDVPLKQFIDDYFGYKHDMLGVAVVVLLGFSVLFFSIFAVALQKLNFQNR
eukprot:jgi/Mesen1/11003/ME000098S10398